MSETPYSRNNRDRRNNNCNSKNYKTGHNNCNENNTSATSIKYISNNLGNNINQMTNDGVSKLASDKELLAAAKKKFASPPTTPVILDQYINFQKGETINPYRIDRTAPTSKQSTNQQQTEHPEPSHNLRMQDSSFELDPMRPPIVRLTEQSVNGDRRTLMARLRDPKIMHIVRLYLAYLKDKESFVCVDGMTRTSILITLASEGLPTSTELLLKVFLDVHAEYGINKDNAMKDLETYRNFISSGRVHRLQQLRESTNNFYKPNFRKN